MVYSTYQTNVFSAVETGLNNLLINAVAGSGKSTTIIKAIDFLPSDTKVLFLAFNKSIVEELKIKIKASNVEVKTLHSLGMSVLIKTFKTKVFADKYKLMVNMGLKNGKYAPNPDADIDLSEYRSNIHKLVDLYRVNLCESVSDLNEIAEKHGLNIFDNECEIAQLAVKEGIKMTYQIDFTDMIYLPVVLGLNVPKFDRVFIDECQDLNRAQKELFLKAVKVGGKFIAVGDPRQAIYGFSGADAQSFNSLKTIDNTIELPLSVSYRCGKKIVELAKTIVPAIEAGNNNVEGDIINGNLGDIFDGDMVLCRTTSPLVETCLSFIAEGKKAYVKGRDIGKTLSNMLKKTNMNIYSDAIQVLENDGVKLVNKLLRKNGNNINAAKNTPEYQLFSDKFECIQIICDGLMLVNQGIDRIDSIFKDDQKAGICFSTIHKAKGLESKRVHIIRPDKFMLEFAMKTDFGFEQETNLKYVAYTRAIEVLNIIHQ